MQFQPLSAHTTIIVQEEAYLMKQREKKKKEGCKLSYRVTRYEYRFEDSIRKVMLQQSQQQMCCSTITVLSCFAMSTAVGHPPVLVSLPCHDGTRQYSFP